MDISKLWLQGPQDERGSDDEDKDRPTLLDDDFSSVWTTCENLGREQLDEMHGRVIQIQSAVERIRDAAVRGDSASEELAELTAALQLHS